MWILKKCKDLLDNIESRSLSSFKSIFTFDISTLHTTISNSKLKDRLNELVKLCFMKKMANVDMNTLFQEWTNIFCRKKKPTDSPKKFSETDINMVEVLIDNIFAMFNVGFFQQTVDILMGTNCAPILTYLFLYSYRCFSRKTKRSQPDPLISLFAIQMMFFHWCQFVGPKQKCNSAV